MQEVVLHIGVHKTGTSFLQSFFCDNAEFLAERGVVYQPGKASWNSHNPLVAALPNKPNILREYIDRQFEQFPDKRVLISSEFFCNHQFSMDSLMESLAPFNVSAIAYLRHPCDIVLSAFDEIVRSDLHHWSTPINEPPFAFDPSQFAAIKPWLRAQVPLTIAPYDQKQWMSGNLACDMLAMLHVPTKGFQFHNKRENASLPYPATELLRLANAAGISGDDRKAFISYLRTLKFSDWDYPLTNEVKEHFFSKTRRVLDEHFRPALRAGFDEEYLFEPRPVS